MISEFSAGINPLAGTRRVEIADDQIKTADSTTETQSTNTSRHNLIPSYATSEMSEKILGGH